MVFSSLIGGADFFIFCGLLARITPQNLANGAGNFSPDLKVKWRSPHAYFASQKARRSSHALCAADSPALPTVQCPARPVLRKDRQCLINGTDNRCPDTDLLRPKNPMNGA